MQWHLNNGKWVIITVNETILFFNTPIQAKSVFIAEHNFLVKVGIGGHGGATPELDFVSRKPRSWPQLQLLVAMT